MGNIYKACFKCGELKPLTDYYKHKQMKDGHLNKCKECAKLDVAKHRAENLEKVRAYDRARGRTEHRKSKVRRRAEERRTEDPGCRTAYQQARREIEPEKYAARTASGNAIRDGQLVRPDMCTFGPDGCDGKIEGHHHDYSKPLDVVWVCMKHHRALHRKHEDERAL